MVNIIDENQLDVTEEQYRRIVLVDWQGHDSFKDKPLHECSTMEFWTSVFHTQDFKVPEFVCTELSVIAITKCICGKSIQSGYLYENKVSQSPCYCNTRCSFDAQVLFVVKIYLLQQIHCSPVHDNFVYFRYVLSKS